MQSTTRVNLEECYRYHAGLAEFHKRKMEESGGGGEGGEGEKPPEIDNTLPPEQPNIDNTLPTTPPTNRDVPLVMGDAFPGGTLTCTMGNWDGEPDSYQYNWKSDGQPAKATTGGDTYQVLPEDVGHNISCVVVATNAAGSTEAPQSNEMMIQAEGTPQSQSQAQQQQPDQSKPPGEQSPPIQPRRAVPTANQGTQSGQRSTTESRDQSLFNLHDETAKQLRSALDSWKEPPTQQQMRDERPITRRTSRATARQAAADTARRPTRH